MKTSSSVKLNFQICLTVQAAALFRDDDDRNRKPPSTVTETCWYKVTVRVNCEKCNGRWNLIGMLSAEGHARCPCAIGISILTSPVDSARQLSGPSRLSAALYVRHVGVMGIVFHRGDIRVFRHSLIKIMRNTFLPTWPATRSATQAPIKSFPAHSVRKTITKRLTSFRVDDRPQWLAC